MKHITDIHQLARNIRGHALRMAHSGKSSHIGSALSVADILAVLYGYVMNFDIKNPRAVNRDRFILSKGHAGSAVYATLAETGFLNNDMLKDHYQNGSVLSGHVSHKGIPGVELSTGSLGHGLSIGTGMALAAKKDDLKHKVFVVLSDGECDEGSTWEAVMFAAHHKLDNLVAIVDYNKIQSLDLVANTIGLEPFADKWKSFNWDTHEVDGNNINALIKVFDAISLNKTRPHAIIAHTIKGKGVSFMENQVLWHYRWPRADELEAALKEINS